MLGYLQNGRIIFASRSFSCQTCRRASTKTKSTTSTKKVESLVAKGDIAKQLEKSGVWNGRPGRKKAGYQPLANEPRRVNIVSRKLCDDIIEYIGPSLQRHEGCDLIDLNPGAGLWSKALHEHLKPRKHILMDLDAELYKPYLADLLEKKNVEIIPKSGLVWKDLLEMTRTSLTHQPHIKPGEAPTRNDTLLVTANLSMFPKKPYRGFESISTMVLYQFMSSIRQSTLFQRYGLVRMLIWINEEDKRALLPRSLTRRRRSAFEAELSCDWLHEVASPERELESRTALRDEWINLESGYNAVYRMKGQGLRMPLGRETNMYKKVLADPTLHARKLAGVEVPFMSRPFKQELGELETEHEDGGDDGPSARLKMLRQRAKYEKHDAQQYLDLLQERDNAFKLFEKDPVKLAAADATWNERVDNFNKNGFNEFQMIRDNYHVFRQSPTALLWDRRAYEPLTVSETEFFPNAPTALLDIQPKAMDPILRQHGPNTSRSGDMADVMLRFWFNNLLVPIPKAMESLWAGFGDHFAQCPSMIDPKYGGSPMSNHGVLLARGINEQQWIEIMRAWMNWSFRPEYTRMVGRLADETDYEDEDGSKSSATGLS